MSSKVGNRRKRPETESTESSVPETQETEPQQPTKRANVSTSAGAQKPAGKQASTKAQPSSAPAANNNAASAQSPDVKKPNGTPSAASGSGSGSNVGQQQQQQQQAPAAAASSGQQSDGKNVKQDDKKPNFSPPNLAGAVVPAQPMKLVTLNPSINKVAATLIYEQSNLNFWPNFFSRLKSLVAGPDPRSGKFGIGFNYANPGEKDPKTGKFKVDQQFRVTISGFGSIMNTSKLGPYGDHKCKYNGNLKSEFATPELKNSKVQAEFRSIPPAVLAYLAVTPNTPESDFMALEMRAMWPKAAELENKLQTLYQENATASQFMTGRYSELIHSGGKDYAYLRSRTNLYIAKNDEMREKEAIVRAEQKAFKDKQRIRLKAEGKWTKEWEDAPLPIDKLPEIYDPAGLHKAFNESKDRKDYIYKAFPFTDDKKNEIPHDQRILGPQKLIGYPDVHKWSMTWAIHTSKCHGWANYLNSIGWGIRVPQSLRDTEVASTTDQGVVEAQNFTGFVAPPTEYASSFDAEPETYEIPRLEKPNAQMSTESDEMTPEQVQADIDAELARLNGGADSLLGDNVHGE